MALRVKGKATAPLRDLVYVSDLKLQMFLDQIDEPVRASIAAPAQARLETGQPHPRKFHCGQITAST